MIIKDLSEPFHQDAVHWRVQGKPYERNGAHSAMALSYIDARDVMDKLDAVCGPENWQDDYVETPKGRIICRIGIKIGDAWVWKSDGAGDTAVEGDKGGISDALKRAAVHWGIGRYLYRLDAPWVACSVKPNGQWKAWVEDPWSKVKNVGYTQPKEPEPFAADTEGKRLKAGLTNQKTEQSVNALWAQPNFQSVFDKLPKAMQGEIRELKYSCIDGLAERAAMQEEG